MIGSICWSVSGTIITSSRPTSSEILKNLRFSPRGIEIMSFGSRIGCARLVAPRNFEAAAETEEILHRVEVAVQARAVMRRALGDADDETARPFTGAPALRP